ncbi:hypothetical protein CDV36_006521 [Fusarium kuroshium]|uniref:Uncharacterized protein n=3 Tax=Fusarium solani species complex TaxID=232080 RepID=A0A3M2S8F9_9HYPO|nr:hypothetical protein CDV36_006521 [Fusarium kuroshium]RSL75310.1 hypothetical protein CEP51_010982 [Fusarium floridanum]RSM06333.1 hypothetical protein CEP52_005757 [Fusarium oligoseptatum]
MLPPDGLQGLNDQACFDQVDYRSQSDAPNAPNAPATPVSKVRASTARRRLALTSKPVNTHLAETIPRRLSTAVPECSSSAPLPTPSTFSAPPTPSTSLPASLPSPPLPSPPLAPPVAAHHPPSSVRRPDPGLHVEPTSPRLHSPLRHSVTFSNDIDLAPESQFQSPPAGHVRPQFFDMAFTGDKRTTAPRARTSLPAVVEEAPRNRFPGWFSRASVPAPNAPASSSTPAVPEARPRSGSSASKIAAAAALSRFNIFGAISTPATPASPTYGDELMNLDIEKGLFPNGAPVEGSTFSPSSFKNLQMNAIGLLSKFQVAYQQRTTEVQELKAERETEVSSMNDAGEKIRQLEKKLDDQARQAAERDSFIEYLLNQLADQKDRADLEAEANREKELTPSGASTISEDLGIDEDRQRRWRKSTSTSSDDGSVDEASVFSRSRSPTISTSIMSADISPVATPTIQYKPVIVEPPRANRNSSAQMNPIQKLFKGMTSEAPRNTAPETCRNCQGQEASIAWDTVNLLKDENKGLKQRVEELETAVEGALDVVNGLVL